MATAPLSPRLLGSPSETSSGVMSGPRAVPHGLDPLDLTVVEEVQWVIENATGALLPATDPSVLSVASVAAGLRSARVPQSTFIDVVAREARLQRLPAVPEVLAHRLWAVTRQAFVA